MATKKFTDKITKAAAQNPAEQVISAMETAAEQEPAGVKETKTKRASFLVRPTEFDDAKTIAMLRKESLNSVINDALSAYIENNRDLLARYKNALKDFEI